MKKAIRGKIVAALGCLVLCLWASCESKPPEQGREEAPGGNQVLTVLPVAEGDPYSDSLEGKPLPERVELFFFYEQSCEICDELSTFYNTLSKELPGEVRNTYPHLIYTINTVSAGGRKTYERVTDAMGLDRMLLQAPLLIAGGRVYQGHETIANNLREAFLCAGEELFTNRRFYNPALKKSGDRLFEDYSLNPGHAALVYFYRIVCPFCEQTGPLIDGLGETVSAGGGEVPLDIIRINTRTGNNNERIMAFFEKYQVPDADRIVPIVFFANGYLSGVEAISAGLGEKLTDRGAGNRLAELIPWVKTAP